MKIKKLSQILDINLVKPSPSNPKRRTTPGQLQKLAANLAERGQRKAVNVVADSDGTYVLADGHRRFAALKANGATSILVDINYPQEGETVTQVVNQLFSDLNDFTRRFSEGDRLERRLREGSEAVSTGNVEAAALKIEGLFDQRDRLYLADKGVTPHILSVAKRVTAYCLEGSGVGDDTATFRQRFRKTLFWLIEMKAQQWAIVYMRMGYAREALKRAVDGGRHVPRTTPASAIEKYEASKKR